MNFGDLVEFVLELGQALDFFFYFDWVIRKSCFLEYTTLSHSVKKVTIQFLLLIFFFFVIVFGEVYLLEKQTLRIPSAWSHPFKSKWDSSSLQKEGCQQNFSRGSNPGRLSSEWFIHTFIHQIMFGYLLYIRYSSKSQE